MLLSVVDRWSPGPDVQCYFDPCARRVLYLSRNYLCTKSVDDYSNNPYHDLGDFRYIINSHGLIGLCLTSAEDYAALHRTENLLTVLRLQDLASTQLPLPKRSRILGYHWVQTPLWDLVLLHSGGVMCLQLTKNPLKVKVVKTVSLQIGVYWLEVRTATVVVGKQKPGEMLVLRLNEKSSTKKLKGPTFSLNLPKSTASKWTNGHCFPVLPQPRLESHCCSLGKLYEFVYFIHFSQLEGTVKLYKIEEDSVQLGFTPISLPGKTESSIKILDNLLIIQCFCANTEFIYDIQTPWCDTRPFCTIIHSADAKSVPGNWYKSPEVMHRGLLSYDQDVYLDPVGGICYKSHIVPLEIVKKLNTPLDGVLFLMRRLGGKYDAFALLRETWSRGVEIHTLPAFLRALKVVYFDTTCGHSASLVSAQSQLNTASTQLIEEIEYRIVKEKTAVYREYQIEIVKFVLGVLVENSELPGMEMKALLMEFIRSLLESDIEVCDEVERLLASHLIGQSDLTGLYDCIEYGVFRASKEVCQLMEGNVLHDQLAVLEEWEALERELTETGYDYEAQVCRERSLHREDPI